MAMQGVDSTHSESDEYEESLLIQAETVFDDTVKPSDDEGG